jgi:hypothetical protein
MNFVFILRWLFMAALGSGCLSGALASTQTDDPSEFNTEAAFLCNLGRFVEWPSNTFTSTNAPMLIGIYGKNPFNDELADLARDKSINGHKIIARKVSFNELQKCQILFIGQTSESDLNTILRKVDGAGVLTVTDNIDPFHSGVMINFTTRDDHVRFEINDKAAERVGLKISSKLLNLAIKTSTSRRNETPGKTLCARYP